MAIDFKVNAPITTDQFIGLLESSTLGERRPVQDRACMEGMVTNSNLIVSAWEGSVLVGIGKRLQSLTQEQLGPRCKLILISAPAANSYYGSIGYTHNDRCWVLEPGVPIGS